VRSRIGDSPDADEAARVGRRAAGDAGHEAEAAGEPAQQPRDLLADARLVRAAHDRGEHAIDVAEHGGPGGVGQQRLKGLHRP
jgi:hypothetical protein